MRRGRRRSRGPERVVNRWKAFWRGDGPRKPEAEDLGRRKRTACVAEPRGVNDLAIGGVRGWLRLAGGDNAIRMIQGDLAGSEQSVVRVRANRGLVAKLMAWWHRAARSVAEAITVSGKAKRCPSRSQTARSSAEGGVMPVDPRHWFGGGPLSREGGGVRRRGRPSCTSRSERHAARDDAGPALTAERDEGTGGPAGGTG